MEVDAHWKIRRPKLRWTDVIRKDMKEKRVEIEEAHDRRTWRLKTRCAEPNYENWPNKKKYVGTTPLTMDNSSSKKYNIPSHTDQANTIQFEWECVSNAIISGDRPKATLIWTTGGRTTVISLFLFFPMSGVRCCPQLFFTASSDSLFHPPLYLVFFFQYYFSPAFLISLLTQSSHLSLDLPRLLLPPGILYSFTRISKRSHLPYRSPPVPNVEQGRSRCQPTRTRACRPLAPTRTVDVSASWTPYLQHD